MKKTYAEYVADHQEKLPPVLTTSLAGKVVIVIGANVGIGYETAKHFASMNAAKVILGCRSREKGEKAAKEIASSTGNPNVELKIIDLTSFDSIRTFADEVDKEYERLDLLIENAAMSNYDKAKTVDGWDEMLQANVLGQEFLSFLLLPKLFATAQKFDTTPRIVVVSSEMHYWVETDFKLVLDTLESGDEKSIHRILERHDPTKSAVEPYQLQKLLNIFFTRAFNAHLPTPSPSFRVPIISSMNPGLCTSQLSRNVPPGEQLDRLIEMENAFGRTPEEGSRLVIFCAIGPNPESAENGGDLLRGEYIEGGKGNKIEVREVSDAILDANGQKVQQLMWDDKIKIFQALDGRIKDIVTKHLNER